MSNKLEDYMTFYNPKTGDPLKYKKSDLDKNIIIYKRFLEEYKNGEPTFKKVQIFDGNEEQADEFMDKLIEEKYLYHKIPMTSELVVGFNAFEPHRYSYFIPSKENDGKWEIGFINIIVTYTIKEGAIPLHPIY